MVTGWLSVPEVGEMLVMTGSSVKPLGAFAGTPFTVTVTVPFTPAVGTGTTMVLLVHVVGVPTSPLNETVLLLCVGPNPDPVNVTDGRELILTPLYEALGDGYLAKASQVPVDAPGSTDWQQKMRTLKP
jgi:hypothetical protein